MNQEWTVERVKQELPDVTILIKEGMVAKKYLAVVVGRRNAFATVRVPNGMDIEFAWETIANALNNNRPLRG